MKSDTLYTISACFCGYFYRKDQRSLNREVFACKANKYIENIRMLEGELKLHP